MSLHRRHWLAADAPLCRLAVPANYTIPLIRPLDRPSLAAEWAAESAFVHATLATVDSFPSDLLPVAAALSVRGTPFTSESLQRMRVESTPFRTALSSRYEVAGPLSAEAAWHSAYFGALRAMSEITADVAVDAMACVLRGLGRGPSVDS